jgi:hypothetical protein
VAGEHAFYFTKKQGRRRIVLDGHDQLACSWADFWPRRVARAGCFGGPPVGLWAAGPGAGAEAAMGRIFPFGLKGKVVNSNVCQFIFIFSRSNYWCF